jgi:hypothetical protein
VIHTGRLKHYIPENGLYVYFRYNDNASVMIILNNQKEARTIRKDKYAESLAGFSKGYDVITGKTIEDLTSFEIAPGTAMIIELK